MSVTDDPQRTSKAYVVAPAIYDAKMISADLLRVLSPINPSKANIAAHHDYPNRPKNNMLFNMTTTHRASAPTK